MVIVVIEELIERALQAREFSYSPYSGYRVGAALITAEGTIYTGCNIENAAYTPTNCAERTAFLRRSAKGRGRFEQSPLQGALPMNRSCSTPIPAVSAGRL